MSAQGLIFLIFKKGLFSFIVKSFFIILISMFFAYTIPSIYFSLGIFEDKIIGRILFFSFLGFIPLVKFTKFKISFFFYLSFYLLLPMSSIIFNDVLKLDKYDYYSFALSVLTSITLVLFPLISKYLKTKSFQLKTMADIDAMSNLDTYQKGQAFEKYIRDIYRSQGKEAYTTTELREKGKLPPSIQKRGGSGEQGVDVIVYGEKDQITIIQCKHYSQKVSNSAIQEIYGAMNLYEANLAVVVTNNYFTKPAIELAASNGVILVDRDQLIKILSNSKK